MVETKSLNPKGVLFTDQSTISGSKSPSTDSKKILFDFHPTKLPDSFQTNHLNFVIRRPLANGIVEGD